MRDLKADWNRWSDAERMIAIAAGLLFVVAGSSFAFASVIA